MMAGFDELDRWLDDRMRTGLADPALARYSTWDSLAARLVDARAGALANRVRRLAGLVGASPDWHGDVLEEMGLLHLLAEGGRRLRDLPPDLADAVATSVGWQVKAADVLAGVPDTDTWVVAGRSDRREDRIEVRRTWLRGLTSRRWALVLSFAAYRQSLDTTLPVGSTFLADVHRYPGGLRSVVGRRYDDVVVAQSPPSDSIAEACDRIGTMLAVEPWLDRVPATIRATPARGVDGWVLADDDGSLPIAPRERHAVDIDLATLVAVCAGQPATITIEWTPSGVIPLTVHLRGGDTPDGPPARSIDIGPRADPSFVGAA